MVDIFKKMLNISIMYKNKQGYKMTNKEIKKRLLKEMKKDKDLKLYVKDIKELNQKSFGILIKILNKVYK